MLRQPPSSTLFPSRRSSDLSSRRTTTPRSDRPAGSPRSRLPAPSLEERMHMSEDPFLEKTEDDNRSEEHTSELQSRRDLVCRLLLEKKKNKENKQKQENQTH